VPVCVYEVLRRVPRGFSRGEIAKQQSYVLGIYLTVFKSIITSESINSEIHRSESRSSRALHSLRPLCNIYNNRAPRRVSLQHEGRRVTANQPLLPPRPSHGGVCILNSWHYTGREMSVIRAVDGRYRCMIFARNARVNNIIIIPNNNTIIEYFIRIYFVRIIR